MRQLRGAAAVLLSAVIHRIGDRENDIYELRSAAAQALSTHFLVRTCVDRLAGDGQHTIADEMAEVKVKRTACRSKCRSPKGDVILATVELK